MASKRRPPQTKTTYRAILDQIKFAHETPMPMTRRITALLSAANWMGSWEEDLTDDQLNSLWDKIHVAIEGNR